MPSPHPESPTPFGDLAATLDESFSELTRISGQLQRLDIESDSGLQHGLKLLNQFAAHGEKVAAGIQEFAKVLQEARGRAQSAAQLVSGRAHEIGERSQQETELRGKLAQLQKSVETVNASLSHFKKETSGGVPDQQQVRIELERSNALLKKFIGEAQDIRQAAGEKKYKKIEQEALSMTDVLKSASQKIDHVLGPGDAPPP